MKIAAIHSRALLTGILFVVPFFILATLSASTILGLEMQIFAAARSSLEWLLPQSLLMGLFFAVFVLGIVGGIVAVTPLLQKKTGGKHTLYIVNLIFASIIITVFARLLFDAGVEVYQCDILQIPNCD